ncbi:hypothetical protein QWY20_04880 [Alkalimonas sp. MEB108]|uniref:Uncharacterized protein n=1 Tax=Alkalimonas cellulosilytica TaxID=3058395 RepID=A0ABU7J2P7_9GAMM|nr:hypothetical protein [Alkalimonas sp. MEB108]MEE2000778.1 hypothetical protein [Alkalimonas sp. MEB108]
MAELYFPRSAERAEQLFASQPELLNQYRQLNRQRSDLLLPNKPYLMSCQPGDERVLAVMNQFSSTEMQRLQHASALYDEHLLAIAAITEELIAPVMALVEEHGANVASALIGASKHQYNAFQQSIVRYQQALMDLHEVSQAKTQARGARDRGAYNPQIAAKEAQVRRLHADMQQRFQSQLARYKANLGTQANRSALANVDRGVNVARSGRSLHSNTAGGRRTGRTLNISNGAQAQQVMRFIRGLQIASPLVMAWDIRGRNQKVRRVQQSSGDYKRERARQIGGFVSGSVVTSIVVRGVIAIGLGLTPAGWVLLIGASAVAFAASSALEPLGQDAGEFVYDRLL